MVSTVWSVSCLLFYSRLPPCPAICKSGGTCPPCSMESAPLSSAIYPLHYRATLLSTSLKCGKATKANKLPFAVFFKSRPSVSFLKPYHYSCRLLTRCRFVAVVALWCVLYAKLLYKTETTSLILHYEQRTKENIIINKMQRTACEHINYSRLSKATSTNCPLTTTFWSRNSLHYYTSTSFFRSNWPPLVEKK